MNEWIMEAKMKGKYGLNRRTRIVHVPSKAACTLRFNAETLETPTEAGPEAPVDGFVGPITNSNVNWGIARLLI